MKNRATSPSSHLRNHVYLIAPAVIFLLIVFVYPLLTLIPVSVNFPNISFGNYTELIDVPLYSVVIFRTFWIAALVTIICLILGYPVAFTISNLRPKLVGVFLVPVILPFWTSLLVRTYAWMVILQRKGMVNEFLQKIGLISKPITLLYNEFSVIVGMVHVLLPFMILPIYSNLQGRDRNLEFAAKNVGANPIKTFFWITLPLSIAGISAGCLLVFVIAIGFFITPALLGGKKVLMISMLIEEQVIEYLNWGLASAISFGLLVITIVIILVYYKIIGLEKVMGQWE
jgi:ABC-type spermidine/putrescine transport system permease subunit I